jgi:hypothetical protein
MNKKPDVLGMNMPAAVKVLDAAGISYTETILNTPKKIMEPYEKTDIQLMRVIRQINNEDGTVHLDICMVPDPLKK